MVFNLEETEKIEDKKFEHKCALFDKQHGYTMLELKAQLKIEAMRALSSGKASITMTCFSLLMWNKQIEKTNL